MNKNIILGSIGALAVAGALASASIGAYAAQTDNHAYGPNYTPERHEQMEKAFENKDYAAWKSLMGDRGAARVITSDNFPKFAEMHELREEGRLAEADKIRTELGLGTDGRYRDARQGARGHGSRAGFVDANQDGVCDRLQ